MERCIFIVVGFVLAAPLALATAPQAQQEGTLDGISATNCRGGAEDRSIGRLHSIQFDGGGGDLEALMRQTEATCGRRYQGSTDQWDHSRFHCMYAYFLQCNNLPDQHRTVCAQYAAMRANGAPYCPHC